MPANRINQPTQTAAEKMNEAMKAEPAQSPIQAPALPVIDSPINTELEQARAIARKVGAQRRSTPLFGSSDFEAPDFDEWRTIKLKDGRHVTLGPPPTPVDLALPKIMNERSHQTNFAVMADNQSIQVCMYVRKIENDVMPELRTWSECSHIIYRLKELGWRAVNNAYLHYFGISETYWSEVKNSQPIPDSDK